MTDFSPQPPGQTQATSADQPSMSGALARATAATLLILLTSVLGLLCLRLDLYDDSAMMLGARLVRAGERPYLDFYTHYGPLVYDVLSLALWIPANPAFLLRLTQSVFLLLAAWLLIWLARQQAPARALFPLGASLTALAVSAVFQLPAFLAFFFCLAALSLIAGLQSAPSRRYVLEAGSGLALTLAALVRPAFGGYLVAGISVLFLVLRSPGERWMNWQRFLRIGAAAIVSLIGLWLLRYRLISPATFWRSAVVDPGHLMASGTRFLRPQYFPALAGVLGSGVIMCLGAAVIFACTISWLVLSSSRRVVRGGILASLIAGAVALLLLSPSTTGREALLVVAVWFSLTAAVVALARREILSSRSLRVAAPFGLASAMFAHYFWARPDRPHLIPLLALAATAAALASGELSGRRRAALLLFFAAGYISLWQIPWSPFPAMHLFNGGVTRILQHTRLPRANWQSIWPAGELPADGVKVVSLADRHADSASRFVAVASSHFQTSGNPILLFLLSARLPYTKWWAYDPGVQSSPAIQREMERELAMSGSETAVVWPAEEYLFEPPVDFDPRRRTEFDQEFLRLYPRPAGRIGLYEIRLRASQGPSEAGR